ncbi:TIGR03862 family flavoprotein [Pseudooceanicola aestuarii]|uniref:TIGR03862 family flavoprotein n=1 Tax=Pseudooceanicola aestuarii TaxID=2697319 RepID=UPI0013D3F1EA|nr:TIGR03862 family flavoprotein [Pseudooceanicola aestuarii]
MPQALVIGGGPAGLMAAEAMAARGLSVTVAEAMPTMGRKFLMAGKSGLNLTKDEAPDAFRAAFGAEAAALHPALAEFGPAEVQQWAQGLGQEVFTGTSGRVFPKVMKASPLLRAWLARLTEAGVALHRRWRWTGFDGATAIFDTPDGPQRVTPDVTVLACGGGSWRRLGSDGAWTAWVGAVAPFAPANCGFHVSWSSHMAAHFGAPVKAVTLNAGDAMVPGEFILTARGVEGGAVYPLAPLLRAGATLRVDLAPDLTAAEITARLTRGKAGDSLPNRLRKALSLPPVKRALLNECARPLPRDPAALAAAIKALPLPVTTPFPLDEAISTAGGLRLSALDAGLMLRARPGTFAAGEMLDWEAPTGGYLITACLATGLWAGRHAADHASRRSADLADDPGADSAGDTTAPEAR